MKATIKNESTGSYELDNLELNTTYTIIHLKGEEPKIEKKWEDTQQE